MEKQEIIAARRIFEQAAWTAFGETLLVMPDKRAARLAYNERAGALYQALPAEVRATLQERQKPIDKARW